ncbi:hemolymph lipopolysaccharide-binding protein [Anabrus simplex]|uniref:hemolymph lipopolysaccharide-binding protein n=1 Tax=Anabrus simplex TaxID=316456 RepID=UPI0035A34984
MTVDLGLSAQHSGDVETSQILATVNLGGSRTPPPGYEVVNAIGFYKMHPTALTMDEGREKCAQEGAHIIVLNSDNEADVIRTFLARKPNIPHANSQEYTFVGLHDWIDEGKFISLLGEPVENSGFNRWRAGEPNGGRNENCVMVDKDTKFVDIDCNWKLFIVCELYDL